MKSLQEQTLHLTTQQQINENEFVIPKVVKTGQNDSCTPFQWRTIHETGRRSCCGGGFVRKFADGTNDWRIRDRLNITPRDFTCLNYRNELAEAILMRK